MKRQMFITIKKLRYLIYSKAKPSLKYPFSKEITNGTKNTVQDLLADFNDIIDEQKDVHFLEQ